MQLDKLIEWRYWKAFTEPDIWQFLWTGLQATLEMAAVAIVASLILGTGLAFARIGRNPLSHYPAAAFIEIVRSLPVLYLIFFAYFGGARFGLQDPQTAATLALTLYTAAVNAEIIRAGILSIDRGEIEAARSLGLSHLQAMRHVVVPQAFRRIVPPQVGQLVTLVKDTSLAYIVGTTELMQRIKVLYSTFEIGTIQGLVVAALIYFSINYTLSLLSRRLEERAPASAGTQLGTKPGVATAIRPASI
ncbi:MAG: amino acid ABC transporter permease [Chloroflexi bacterium]|nr:amino acid ABC transporter permease [Chloroflexota bacterium]